MNRHALGLGLLASLSFGCDRVDLSRFGVGQGETGGDATEPSEPEPASTEPGSQPTIAPTQPTEPGATVVEPAPTAAVEPAAVEPAPAPAPALPPPDAGPSAPLGPGPLYVGEAQDILAAVLAEIPVPPNAVIKDLRRQAFDAFLADDNAEAGRLFALLTKLDPKSAEFPYVAARVAARRDDTDSLQVFLVEALRRDGKDVRAKAKKEASFKDARKQYPWFAELLAADEATLAGWVLRELPPRVIEDYAPGQAPATIAELQVTPIPATGKPNEQARLRVQIELRKPQPVADYGGFLGVTCQIGDRYVFDYGHMFDNHFSDAGERVTIRWDLMAGAWPEPRDFETCEVQVIGRSYRPERSYHRLLRVCWTPTGTTEGPCSSFARVVEEEPRVRSVVPELGGDGNLEVFFEYRLGRRPERDARLGVSYVCEAPGGLRRGVVGNPLFVEHGVAGDSVQTSATSYYAPFAAGKPSRCTFEVVRLRGGPVQIGTRPVFCYEDGATRPGPCG